MQVAQVQSADELAEVRRLFEEYWNSSGFAPCFQNFGAELANLPGSYVPPAGALALATVEGKSAGCIALRRVDAARGEMKRLYVRPEFRGSGTGLALLKWIVERARAAGYGEIVCDTMPMMQKALAMYDRFGFERCEPYVASPEPGVIYLRMKL
ncbi:MAG TPA: GNAT family N-acetyltransferase [Candidatus Solibacter sp.]|nr:GNAT family N-acetyltransferase [Candidatus Solibacter sp.]